MIKGPCIYREKDIRVGGTGVRVSVLSYEGQIARVEYMGPVAGERMYGAGIRRQIDIVRAISVIDAVLKLDSSLVRAVVSTDELLWEAGLAVGVVGAIQAGQVA